MSTRDYTKFCGYECGYKYRREEYFKKYPEKIWYREEQKCLLCNKNYIPAQRNQLYCSVDCRKIAQEKKPKQTLYYKLRFEILERDHFTCQYCGASPRKNPEVKLHIDHKNPKNNGGGYKKNNLITACEYCNLGKWCRFYPNIFKNDFPKDE